jgi:hypothetical protein
VLTALEGRATAISAGHTQVSLVAGSRCSHHSDSDLTPRPRRSIAHFQRHLRQALPLGLVSGLVSGFLRKSIRDRRGRQLHWGKGDHVPELLQAMDMVTLYPLGVQAVEVVRSQVMVGLLVTQQVVDHDE